MYLVNRLQTIYTQARTKKRRLYENWRRNFLILCNRMWSDYRTASWMPSPTDSEVYPIVSAVAAWMTDQSVVASVSPAADPSSPMAMYYAQLSKDLQTVIEANWYANNWDRQVALAVFDAAIFGS